MEKYMEIACKSANEGMNNNEGGPFGAVIIKDNKIVSVAHNTVLKSNDPTAHAEIVAIRAACKTLNTFNLTGCEIYTNCYPCPMCLSAIIWSNIKVVYYGNTKEDADEIGFRDNIIYKYLEMEKTPKDSKELLKIIEIDREETIKTFDNYKNKTENKTMY